MRLTHSSFFMRIVVLALIVYAAVMLANVRSGIAAAEADRDARAAEAEALRRENLVLEYELEHSDDPELIADLARARFGLVKPGERVFYDIGN